MADGSKRCAQCGQSKAPGEFSKQKVRKDGLDPYCKACRSEKRAAERAERRVYNAAYREANRDRIAAKKTASYHANVERELARSKRWHVEHRERENAKSSARQRANLPRIYARRRKFYAANPKRKREVQAAQAATLRLHRAANREKYSEYSRKRRVLEQGSAPAEIATADLAAKWAYWGGRCWLCGGEAVEWDHVKPLSKGGAHCLANLRPACRSCNAQKQSRWPL